MPFKSEKIIIAHTKFDKRIKLTDDQKKQIKFLYENTDTSQRKLAREFNVSRRLIQFIVFPEKHEIQKELYKERRKDGKYYNKEKNYTKIHRRYKQDLYIKNLIGDINGN